MLTVICPHCHHRLSMSGCRRQPSDAPSGRRDMAEAEAEEEEKRSGCCNGAGCSMTTTQSCYTGGFLVPRSFTSGGGCFVKAPTIIQGPVVVQSGVHCGSTVLIVDPDDPDATDCSYDVIQSLQQSAAAAVAAAVAAAAAESCSCNPRLNDSTSLIANTRSVERLPSVEQQRVATTCDLTGGSVTITTHTPDIPDDESGGYTIQSTDGRILVQTPHIEIRPKLTGGGCLVQKRLPTEDEDELMMPRYNTTDVSLNGDTFSPRINFTLPSGFSDNLPGNRGTCFTFDSTVQSNEGATMSMRSRQRGPGSAIRTNHQHSGRNRNDSVHQQNLYCSSNEVSSEVATDNRGGMKIQVSATVTLPPNFMSAGGECEVNFMATTRPSQVATTTTQPSSNQLIAAPELARPDVSARDNASAQSDEMNPAKNRSILNGSRELSDDTPTTPVSWLMPPYPWNLEMEQANRDPNKLRETKEMMLQMCGWYYAGISWQQSETLLKNMPVGRWLMRDSSDSRYAFAVSVQTTRGPTSIRVTYLSGGFRFDAEPSMALAMPFFSCPIKMLEHYIEYSKRMDEQRKEVWVDHSGQMYSQIHLTQPLLKEVKPLSHLARLVVNSHKLPIEHLPRIMRNYIAEYSYTL